MSKDWKKIKEIAKKKLSGICDVCDFCDGVRCRGKVPGIGGVGTGEGFINNVKKLREIKIKPRYIHGKKEIDISFNFLGMKFSTPILVAPITGAEENLGGVLSEEELAEYLILGAWEAGSFGFSGDGDIEEKFTSGLKAIEKACGCGIPIIKPRSQDKIKEQIRQVEEIGAMAVGIDIDSLALITMTEKNQDVVSKTKEEIFDLVQYSKLPFIIKGILSLEDALDALSCGVSGIIVSNHGGRISDALPSTVEVLKDIAKELKGKITIFADGGVRSGFDVFKYIALGADAVLVGRPMIIAAVGGKIEGVKLLIEKYSDELKKAMLITGCENLSEISSSKLIY